MTPREACIQEFAATVNKVSPKYWGSVQFDLHFVDGELKHWNITTKRSRKYKNGYTSKPKIEENPTLAGENARNEADNGKFNNNREHGVPADVKGEE